MNRRNYYQPKTFISKPVNNDEYVIKFFTVIASKKLSEIKEFIANNNININCQNENGDTALHILLNNVLKEEESVINEIVKYLLINGITVNKKNKYNITPIHLAIANQLETVVIILAQNNADFNAVDNNGMTVHHYFASSKSTVCEDKIKVGDLVPKADTNNAIPVSEIKNLTQTIIKILLNNKFSQLLTHIDKTVSNLNNFYPQKFELIESKVLKEINETLINKNIGEYEKKARMSSTIAKNMEALYNDMSSSKLTDTFKKLVFAPIYKGGWYPNENSKEYKKLNKLGIMEYSNPMDYYAVRNKSQEIKSTITTLFNTFKENVNTQKDTFNKLYNELQCSSLHTIWLLDNFLFHNKGDREIRSHLGRRTVRSNRRNPTVPDAIDNDYIVTNIGAIFFQNYNNIPLIKDTFGNNDLIAYNDLKNLYSTTECKSNLEYRDFNSEIRNHNDAEKTPLTIDNQIMTGWDINMQDVYYMLQSKTNAGNGSSLYEVKGVGTLINKLNSVDATTEYIFLFSPLYEYCNNIFNKIEEINVNIINELLKFTDDIFFNIRRVCGAYSSLLSIIKLIREVNRVQLSINNVLNDLDNRLRDALNKNKTYPYAFRIEQAITYFQNAKKTFDQIIENTNKVYQSIVKLNDGLIKNIELINLKSGEKYIEKFNEDFITNWQNMQIDQIFTSTFNYTNNFPLKFVNISDMDLVMNYLVSINNNNNPILYFTRDIANKGRIGYLSYNINLGNLPDLEIIGGKKSNDPQNLDDMDDVIGSAIYKKGLMTVKKEEYKFNRKDGAIASVSEYLDVHLFLIKYNIISYVIRLFYDPDIIFNNRKLIENKKLHDEIVGIREVIKNYFAKISSSDTLIETPLYTLVGEIVDDLLISYIDNALHKFCNDYIKTLLFDGKKSFDLTIKPEIISRKFSFNFDQKLYIENIMNVINVKNNVSKSLQNIIKFNQNLSLDADELQLDGYYTLYSQNYIEDSNNICTIFKNDILNTIIGKNKKINVRDKNGMSPIFYGIQQGNNKLVTELLKNGIDLSVKNNNGLNVVQYSKQMLLNHLSHCDFYKEINSQIVADILSHSEFNNNLIIGANTIFPQIINLYSTIFFNSMLHYNNFWLFENTKSFFELAANYRLISTPINIGELSFMLYKKQMFDSLFDTNNDNMLSLADYSSKIYNANEKIMNVNNQNQSSKNELFKEDAIVMNNAKNDRINFNDKFTIKTDSTKLENNVSTIYNKGKNKHLTNVNNFRVNEAVDPITIFDSIYDKIYYTENGMQYTKDWDNYINDTTIKNYVTNIFELERSMQKLAIKTETSMQPVLDLYEKIFTPLAKSYKGDKSYNQDNIMLTLAINAITHVLRTNILNNFYYSIMKMLLKYVDESGATEVDKKFIEFEKYKNYQLKAYILKEMPLVLVKNTLKIYDSTDDNKNDNIDVVFNRIIDLIKGNLTININIDSPYIIALVEKIFPYYKYIITKYVIGMKLVIDNYNNYLINNYRNLKIYNQIKKMDQGN
jgi:ankyrin repeat protein